MTEIIDLSKMPYEEAVKTAMRIFDIDLPQAEERVSISQGIVTGDVIGSSRKQRRWSAEQYKGGRGSGNFRHAGIPGFRGGSAPTGGGMGGFEYPLKANPTSVPWQDFQIAGKSGAEWVADSDAMTARKQKRLVSQLQKNPELDPGAIQGYSNKLATHRRLIIEEALQVAQKYNLSDKEQQQLMRNLVKHDTVDKYDPKIATPYIKYMMTKNADDAYWAAVNIHHDVNSHHAEYWVDHKTKKPKQVPTITIIEMAGDWRGTSRFFNTPLDGYYRKYGEKRADSEFNMHPKTRQAAERELGITDNPFPNLFPPGFKAKRTAGHYRPGLVPSTGIEAVLADLTVVKRPPKVSR